MNYKKIYNNLVDKQRLGYRCKKNGVYYEAHHIIPRCFGGDGDGRNINHSNIVLLTPKEHYIAHLLLTAIYPKSKAMLKAFWCMCQTGKKERYKVSARIFQRIRLEYIKSVQGENGIFYGKKHTSESIIKISNASKGRKGNLGNKHTIESKQKMSKSRKDKIFISDETKQKISKATSGEKHYNAKLIICTKTSSIFGSGKELSEFLNIPFSTIRRWLNGTTNPPHHFHYKRQNMAYDQ
jgi:hypothetical protein